ncbi:unnamed protein product, partial [Mesorhabditis belari]|uniref:Protein-tyrosine phosphatase n=1 Tax=Mesorhabditis belari TaxID=2138241 RepID=A0AAF3FRP7_9BILA
MALEGFPRKCRGEEQFCPQEKGPLDGTIADFWLMMLQEESDTIVMLCDFVDNEGYTKCAQYFPRKKNQTMRITEKLEITNVETHHQIIDEMSWLKIRHFMWEGWREGEVPSCLRTPIELLSQIRGSQKPIVMHCGGGTGRTSILVAIEYLLECSNLKRGIPTMCDLMKKLRSYRLWSILFDLQYLYIHRVIFDHFLDRQRAKFEVFHQEKNRAKYEKFVKDYKGPLQGF